VEQEGPGARRVAEARLFYGEQIVFETNSGGIGVYDPATGNSNWISM
jgi:hypothetical protein